LFIPLSTPDYKCNILEKNKLLCYNLVVKQFQPFRRSLLADNRSSAAQGVVVLLSYGAGMAEITKGGA
jgi:hypothetical protein